MRRRVPLNAIRAFEAAARHKSMTRAASELCVTPTAVSHHVRLLEDFLQVQLFDRSSSQLTLTPPARSCLDALSGGLDRIDAALIALVKDSSRERIIVGASPSFSSLWLMPRLQRFVAMAPHIDVIVTAINNRAAFDDDSLDVSVVQWERHSDLRLEHLMEEDVFPVCSPDLLKRCASDQPIMQLPLIHDDKAESRSTGLFPNWSRYFDAFDMERETNSGLRFNQSSLAVEAALKGYGMVLGRGCLIEPHIKSGELVRLHDSYPLRFEYFVASKWQPERESLRLFREWMLDEASGSRPQVVQAAE